MKFAIGGFLLWIRHCMDDVQPGHLGARSKRWAVAVTEAVGTPHRKSYILRPYLVPKIFCKIFYIFYHIEFCGTYLKY